MRRKTFRGVCLCYCILLITITLLSPRQVNCQEVVTIKIPKIDNPTMPKVTFNHDKHVAFVEAREGDCSRCHRMTSEGFSTAVLDVRLQKEDRQVNYLHTACTDCHKASGHGPTITECRACHAKGNALRAMNK
ncbi:MAG: cytochrome c family protein [Desulfovibrio sp.]|nr:cytochrome c family protein [Desulfovibrio sp.]